jgi:undecaprenyl-diphosphatase
MPQLRARAEHEKKPTAKAGRLRPTQKETEPNRREKGSEGALAVQPRVWAFRGILLVCAAAFIALAAAVPRHGAWPWEEVVLSWFYARRSPVWDALGLAVTQTASTAVLAPLVLFAFAAAYRAGRNWSLLAVAAGGSLVLDQLFKLLLARPRPRLYPPLVMEASYSFPSGHAMSTLAVALVFYLLVREIRPNAARLFLAVGVVWSFLVGLSRLYLQVHYPSDIVAGWSLAVLWVFGLTVIWPGRDSR